ncbi:hypothetical protein [Lentzea aerocolonigenes]|uniref:hypothetical protein n=1 Tax=Lentzea aerocolonigenes TaxID=68170 RepID=UPI000B211F2F|nr:hypothetical protein [Lentzea aerocolonigenes]MCP2245754.1 hypothetical protein [Lentzea aerocolonigenes]
MTEPAPTGVSLALHFGNVVTLSEMTQVLQDIHDGYEACLQALEPPKDMPVGEPRVIIRTGSLFVELTAAIESGAWVAGAVVLMKAVLTNSQEVINVFNLPVEIVDKVQARWHDFRKNRRLRRIEREQLRIDDAAREAVGDKPASIGDAPTRQQSTDNTRTPSPPPRGDHGAIPEFKATLNGAIGFVGTMEAQMVGRLERVDELDQVRDRIVATLGTSHDVLPELLRLIEAANGLIASASREAAGILGHVIGRLVEEGRNV